LWEVTDDARSAAAPKGGYAFLRDDTFEAVVNAGVGLGETTQAEQLVLYDKSQKTFSVRSSWSGQLDNQT
jgi:hypothetical protein